MKIIPQNGMIVGELLGLYQPPRDEETKIVRPDSMSQTTDDVVGIIVTAVDERGEWRGDHYETLNIMPGQEILTLAMFLKQVKNSQTVMIRQSEVLAVVEENADE